jgi:cystathionine beta-lyase/cystathionine gamma-synthase
MELLFVFASLLIKFYILTKHSCYGRTETANVAASGMGAITPTLQLCGTGDHIVSSHYDIWLELTRS